MIGAWVTTQLLGLVTGGLTHGASLGSVFFDGIAMLGEVFIILLPIVVNVIRWLIWRRSSTLSQILFWTSILTVGIRVFMTVRTELLQTRIDVADHKYDAGNACVIDPRTNLLKTTCKTLKITPDTWPIVIAVHNLIGAWTTLAFDIISQLWAWVKSGIWSLLAIAMVGGFIGRRVLEPITRRIGNQRRVAQHQRLEEKLAMLQEQDDDNTVTTPPPPDNGQ
jgi:hypothetical protein